MTFRALYYQGLLFYLLKWAGSLFDVLLKDVLLQLMSSSLNSYCFLSLKHILSPFCNVAILQIKLLDDFYF